MDSAHIHPHAAAIREKLCLQKTAVSRLVVACMEAILEDLSLDVVSLVPLFKRRGFYLHSSQESVDDLLSKKKNERLTGFSLIDW